jgi:hypothetical protein
MDFPSRLENIDKKLRDKWNDEIEEFLGKPPSSSSDIIPLKEFDDDAVKSSLEATALVLQIELLAYNTQNETAKIDEYIGDAVRTGKNLLRWFIQIYLEQRRGRRESGGTIDYLRSIDILSNIVGILKWSVDTKDNTKLARDSSLFIFYATFSQFPGDVIASKGINHLITELSFPSLSLEILMKTNSVALALSLVRNLHSMVVSFPGAQKVILNTEIQWDPSTAMKSAPWAIEEPFTINLSLSCLELMKWSLDAPPSFPDENSEDKRAELVIEILNLFYALRKGQELVDTTTNNSVLANAVVRILQLPFSAQTNDDNENDNGIVVKRIEQCKLSAISILMDSDASFGKYLLEIGSLDALLQILKRQVDNVVDNTRIDSAATAAIVPILAVLNKYSMANSDVQQQVKAFVFPSETEKLYQQAVKENRKTKMSPLDAPKDSLRGKIVVLLSWVDGYIKRCSAELMWTLCNSDYSEYTCRVGMGNALTLLNSKGLSPVQIPT